MPAKYKDGGGVVGGWQDSLEEIIRTVEDIELYIAFEGFSCDTVKNIDGVTYIPVPTKDLSLIERRKERLSWKYNEKRVVKGALEVIKTVKPDLIHVFGMEWSWASVASYTNIPIVIHIMGSMIPYYNGLFPPGYSKWDFYLDCFPNIKKMFDYWASQKKNLSWRNLESNRWHIVKNYMGRTNWDRALMNTLQPSGNYYHVDEALRSAFLINKATWNIPTGHKISLVSIGCSTFLKGIDVMLKTANVLRSMNIDFEWSVAGAMHMNEKRIAEKKEKLKFEENNIKILGYLNQKQLVELLRDSTIYVHAAYCENSPNSICEAQIIGVPIVSTNVGGISTLIRDCGVLVPANDPWQLANAIVELWHDKERMEKMSKKGQLIASNRHNPDNIKKQLLDCYKNIIEQR